MKRLLLVLLICAFVLPVALAGAARSYVHDHTQYLLRMVMQTDVQIGSARLSMMTGEMEFGDVQLPQPPGFAGTGQPTMLHIDSVLAVLQPASLLQPGVHITELHLDGVRVVYADTAEVVNMEVAAHTIRVAREAPGVLEDLPDVRIDTLYMTDGVVRAVRTDAAGSVYERGEVSHPLPTLELATITGEESVDFATAMQAVLDALLRASQDALAMVQPQGVGTDH